KTGKISKESRQLQGLSPYFDDDGVMRVRGRIDATACVPHSARRPNIQSHRHTLTVIVVHHYPEKIEHQNHDATIGEIRKKFWIPSLRRMLRNVVADCQIFLPEGKYGTDIESENKSFQRPFTYTGVDYFGLLLVNVGRRKETRWEALCTCLTL
ncbi:hypothetical protein KR067_003610, partial [Drosophila pandora]